MSQLNVNTVRGQDGIAAPDTQALGQGQTYQNVTAQRVIGTTYTNSTGRTILAVITVVGATPNVELVMTINGVAVRFGSGNVNSGQATGGGLILIPSGATYVLSLVGGGSLSTWIELRT